MPFGLPAALFPKKVSHSFPAIEVKSVVKFPPKSDAKKPACMAIGISRTP